MAFPLYGAPIGDYNAIPTQQLYEPYGVDETSAFAWQTEPLDGQVVTTPGHNLQPSTLSTWEFSPAHSSAVLAGTSLPAFASPPPAGPAPPKAGQSRKRKAVTLRPDDWEPYKKRILDLHIEQNKPLPEVRQVMEKEYGFKAEYVASL